MLDRDLAEFYGVTTGNLNKAVLRNTARFPEDFMFQLTRKEFENLLFQIGRTSWGGRRTPPRAFTEQGFAMLSEVLLGLRESIIACIEPSGFHKLFVMIC